MMSRRLQSALSTAQAEQATRYEPLQRDLLAYAFDIQPGRPSSGRAARAVATAAGLPCVDWPEEVQAVSSKLRRIASAARAAAPLIGRAERGIDRGKLQRPIERMTRRCCADRGEDILGTLDHIAEMPMREIGIIAPIHTVGVEEHARPRARKEFIHLAGEGIPDIDVCREQIAGIDRHRRAGVYPDRTGRTLVPSAPPRGRMAPEQLDVRGDDQIELVGRGERLQDRPDKARPGR